MLAGDLSDLQSQGVNALGNAHWRIHSPLIFERDGIVCRVGNYYRDLWDGGDHSAAHTQLPHLLHLAFGHLPFV